MSTVFHNTIFAKGEELKIHTAQALRQDDKVLEFFKQHAGNLFTPDEVHEAVFDEKTPCTSVRRSIHSLTDAGHLIKTNTMRMGRYGKMTHTWCMRGEPKQLE